jgi:hypothetical protein
MDRCSKITPATFGQLSFGEFSLHRCLFVFVFKAFLPFVLVLGPSSLTAVLILMLPGVGVGVTPAENNNSTAPPLVATIVSFLPAAWPPALNPLVTLLTIRPYRRALVSRLLSPFQGNAVAAAGR